MESNRDMRDVSPSVSSTAFNCPHCGALAKQFWFQASAVAFDHDKTPQVIKKKSFQLPLDPSEGDSKTQLFGAFLEKCATGEHFFSSHSRTPGINVPNIWFSRCFNCEKLAVWLYDRLIYPAAGTAPPANPDMPDEVRRDYDEASTILQLSPRGAAALVRLGIDKLCRQLGDPKKGINDNIKQLVASRLDARVQKALDVVRVVGNNAVHPGQIDLNDDRAAAETLFRLLNLIIEKMISERGLSP